MSKNSLNHHLDGLFSDRVPEPDRPSTEPAAAEPAPREPQQREPQQAAPGQLSGVQAAPPPAEPQPSTSAGHPPAEEPVAEQSRITRPTQPSKVQDWMAFQEQDIEQGRAYILNLLLGGIVIGGAFGVVAMIAGLWSDITRLEGYLPSFIGYLVIVGIFFWRRSGTRWRTAILLTLVYVLAGVSFWYNGPASTGPWYLLGVTLLFFILIGPRAGIVAGVLHVIFYWVLVVLYRFSILHVPQPIELHDSEAQFLILGATFAMITLVLALIPWLYARIQNQILQRLQAQYRSLEEAQAIINERAQELIALNRVLQRQTAHFEVGAQVGYLSTRTFKPEELVTRVVTLVRERLDLDEVSLYQLDDEGQMLILQACARKPGIENDRATRVPVGERGPLRECIERGEARIVDAPEMCVEEGVALSEARLMLFLPLVAQEKTIGCVILQSGRAQAFLPDDIRPLRTFADQVAVAMAYNQTVLDLRQQLMEIENLQRYYVREAWQQFLPAQKQQVFQFAQPGIPPLPPDEIDRLVFERSRSDLIDESGLVMPLAQRGQTIGLLSLLGSRDGQPLDEGQVSVVRAVLEQMELILDNARLFEEARLRAGQERKVRDVATRMRETLDVEGVLRTAIDQIYQTLGLEEVSVHLHVGEEMPVAGSADEVAGDRWSRG